MLNHRLVIPDASSFAALICCGMMFFAGPIVGFAQEKEETVLASVGDDTITEVDLDHVVRSIRVKGQFAQALKTHTEEGRKEVLDKMIETLLLYHGAERDGFLESAEMKRKLRWHTLQLVAEEYAKKTLFSKVPSTEEMTAFYKTHEDLFRRPPEVKVRHIVVKEEAQANKVLEELGGGASFEVLAKENNIDATKKQGGLIGWIRPGMMVEPFNTAAFSLNKGDVSEIVQTRFGFHVLIIEDRKEGAVRPFEEVRKELIKAMREQQLESFKQELSKRWEVKVYD